MVVAALQPAAVEFARFDGDGDIGASPGQISLQRVSMPSPVGHGYLSRIDVVSLILAERAGVS